MPRLLFAVLCLTLLLASAVRAEVLEKPIDYNVDGEVHQGLLAYDDALGRPAPGVLVVHEWNGLGEHPRDVAWRLASLGYVAFALDMYGKGVLGSSPEENKKLSAPFYEDREMMRRTARAGLDVLLDQPQVAPGKVAAIGFCFGGTVVLEMARGVQPLAGVVSFHGGLSTPNPAESLDVPVLALHGADDPHVDHDEVAAFIKEMRQSGADWTLIQYGGAVHSFTNPKADSESARYHRKAAMRSWDHMLVFFDEVLR
ncbi:dienelactone hydrolase family protein [Desulfohalovibrio reitneri]|uniref:dienelactone hydrolase family protein n=1 Tax=Desulfohalovibrio reitneri TaxID=1307759 RepID=UPI0004A7022D|nr:dienelactone hydrolase family protein [Desulfohalovibrio reitneri]